MDDDAFLPKISEAVRSAIRSGNVAQLEDAFSPNIPVHDIAKEAANAAQPAILEWCYTKGWYPAPTTLNDKFFCCVLDGKSPAVYETLMNHGWDINGHESEACGDALYCAIYDGDYDLAKWLLEHGHNPTPKEAYHDSDILSTVVSGETASIRMLQLLLDHGIDFKKRGAGIAATEEGNVEGLRILLDAGLDLEERNMLGWYRVGEDEDRDEAYASFGTALYRACRQGQLECAELLLERGADAHAKDDGGTSCLTIARKRGHQEIVDLLEERGVKE